jgi:hypothetical protein
MNNYPRSKQFCSDDFEQSKSDAQELTPQLISQYLDALCKGNKCVKKRNGWEGLESGNWKKKIGVTCTVCKKPGTDYWNLAYFKDFYGEFETPEEAMDAMDSIIEKLAKEKMQ